MEAEGYTVIRTDDLAKELMERDAALRGELIEILGPNAYSGEKLDRAFVASMIFQDRSLLERVDAAVHPAVTKEVEKIFEEHPTGPVAVESALILQTNFREHFDYIVLIEAQREASIERVVLEGRLTRGQAEARLAEQEIDPHSRDEADFIIENSGSEQDPLKGLEAFQEKCRRLIAMLDALRSIELPEQPLHAA